MAFSTQDPDDPVIGDINVTPLVDVMLVLLIIFMVAAPMLHQGVEVNLPQGAPSPLPLREEDPLVLSVNREGLVYIQDEPVHETLLVDRLKGMIAARGDESVFLKGDREVPYGRIIEVLNLLHDGGITRVGMVTEPLEAPRKRRR
ncbi:MAG: ExbD/TolR family protein [Acidobacteria bacterium]|nr:ExbD/TolR family protein [Acidobacteriota bacterium]